ncbi:unnamed protein product [Adineta steineri]|uniref:Fibrinogen C-terminal domain-containing protein n=1 Tax=Adineta steineri TaxID=433720 RepID=A0A818MBQ4_9BILA|nr:unnamed protein product [Adineta steineri]
MNMFSILLVLYLTVLHVSTIPAQIPYNPNRTNGGLIANGKLNDEPMCKTDDGQLEIPINSKFRSLINTCKVCTCTATGLLCEDQCETPPPTTTTTTSTTTTIGPTESTTTTSTSSSTSSIDQSIVSSTLPMGFLPSSTSNGGLNTGSTPPMGSADNDTASSACARAMAARDYAYVDCSEVYLAGKRTSGIYEIWPRTSPKPFRVLCDMERDGGGWTVLQRRGDYSQQSNFFVSWSSYRRGFGDLTRDFWLGNEKIHTLTNQDEYRLHIDLEDFSNQTRFADYEWFFITNEQTKYTLNLGRYVQTSTGGDSLAYNRGMRFSTRDQDYDQSAGQCAENYHSGWWHAGCTLVNLNGLYLRGNDTTATGVFWNNWLGAKYSLKSCEIKVRPVGFNTEMLS